MKIIECDWLKTNLALFDDLNELVEESEDKSLADEVCNGMGGKFEKNGMSYFFVYVGGKTDNVPTIEGLVLHECIHCAQILLDYKGIETGAENTEVLSYFTEWLFNLAIDFYKEEG